MPFSIVTSPTKVFRGGRAVGRGGFYFEQRLRGSSTGTLVYFAIEMFPLVVQLAAGFRDFARGVVCRDFCGVELITTAGGFTLNSGKIGGEGGNRVGVIFEADQLWVISITACFTA